MTLAAMTEEARTSTQNAEAAVSEAVGSLVEHDEVAEAPTSHLVTCMAPTAVGAYVPLYVPAYKRPAGLAGKTTRRTALAVVVPRGTVLPARAGGTPPVSSSSALVNRKAVGQRVATATVLQIHVAVLAADRRAVLPVKVRLRLEASVAEPVRTSEKLDLPAAWRQETAQAYAG